MDSSKRGRDHPAGKGHGKLTVSNINILNESSSFIFKHVILMTLTQQA